MTHIIYLVSQITNTLNSLPRCSFALPTTRRPTNHIPISLHWLLLLQILFCVMILTYRLFYLGSFWDEGFGEGFIELRILGQRVLYALILSFYCLSALD